MSEKNQKLGAGHARAMLRSGFKEIAQALPAFPAHGVQPVEESGLAGNLTPQEVAKEKGAYETMLDRYSSRDQQQEQDRQLERE